MCLTAKIGSQDVTFIFTNLLIDDQALGKHDDRIDKLEKEMQNLMRKYDVHFEKVDDSIDKIPDVYLA